MKDNGRPILQMHGISKAYPGVQALDKVDFEVQTGEVHALVGENGAGKSTLIKILSGVISPDEGQIILYSNELSIKSPREALEAGIATISQELMLVPQLSVAENILLGRLPNGRLDRVEWREMRRQARRALSTLGLDLDPDAQVGSLSVAEQQATEIARVLSRQADIIIMDEPTSALAEPEVEHLLNYVKRLRTQGKAIIFITHRLDEVFRIADRITVLRDGHKIESLAMNETTPNEVITMMVGRSVDIIFTREEKSIGKPILEVRNLKRCGAFDVSYTLHSGEILGLAGLMGAGRTDAMRALFGVDPFDSGEIWIAGQSISSIVPGKMIAAGLGLSPEDRKRDGLVLGMSVGDNLNLAALSKLDRWGIRNRSRERQIAIDQFVDLSIQAPSLGTEVITLSGGNQQKVVIGKWLATEPSILILDEPTRGIDIGAKAEVYAIMQDLASQGVGIIFISSELNEIMNICDRILVMYEGKITAEFAYGEATEESIMSYATKRAEESDDADSVQSG